MSLNRGECRADFPEVSLQLLDHSEWKLAAYGGFFRKEHIIVYALRYAESSYPPGRLLIFSDNLALVLALWKGRSNNLTSHPVMRGIFASGFTAGFCLIVQVGTAKG